MACHMTGFFFLKINCHSKQRVCVASPSGIIYLMVMGDKWWHCCIFMYKGNIFTRLKLMFWHSLTLWIIVVSGEAGISESDFLAPPARYKYQNSLHVWNSTYGLQGCVNLSLKKAILSRSTQNPTQSYSVGIIPREVFLELHCKQFTVQSKHVYSDVSPIDFSLKHISCLWKRHICIINFHFSFEGQLWNLSVVWPCTAAAPVGCQHHLIRLLAMNNLLCTAINIYRC